MPNRNITLLLLIILIAGLLLIRNNLPQESVPNIPPDITSNGNQQVTIGETYYLFDVADNGPEKVKTLLERAEALSKETESNHAESRIAMVIHGPDINIFDKKNYEKNKEIVDLAARLDASDVIDFKVCKTAADSRGISESSFPAFMEMVPFSADEIERLEDEGYVEL